MNKQKLIERIEKYGTVTDFFKWVFKKMYKYDNSRNAYATAYNFKNSENIHWAVIFAVEMYEVEKIMGKK